MQEQLLEIKGLDVVYDNGEDIIHAVNGIDLVVNKKETLGIVGETGAGKTTTAMAILRLIDKNICKIRDGSIFFKGRDLLTLPESEMLKVRGSQISMIFQDPMTSLNPVITVGEQIAEVLRIHAGPGEQKADIDKKVDEMLTMVGISPSRKNEYPHQFSGGMKQRVVIAIALACTPELLIADEPTTALDVTIQAQVLNMMYNLKEKLGTSIILITHDLGVVAELCDKVAIMYAGEVIEVGSVYDIFESDKLHPYTRGLFDSIPDIHQETDRLNPIHGLMPDPADLPKGCKFHTRCPHCMECCKEGEVYRWQQGSHTIACNLFKTDEVK